MLLDRNEDPISLERASISCRVCARGVAFSSPYLTGAISVDIGGGETGLGCVVYCCLATIGHGLRLGQSPYHLALGDQLG